MDLVSLLIALLVLAVVVYVGILILNMLPLPQPIKTIIGLIFAVIILLYLIRHFGYGIP